MDSGSRRTDVFFYKEFQRIDKVARICRRDVLIPINEGRISGSGGFQTSHENNPRDLSGGRREYTQPSLLQTLQRLPGRKTEISPLNSHFPLLIIPIPPNPAVNYCSGMK